MPRGWGGDAVGYWGTTRENPMATYQDAIMQQLAEAEEQLAVLTANRDKLRAELLATLKGENATRYSGPFGKVSVCERATYSFPAEIEAAEIRLKAEKDIAKKTGTAMISGVTEYLRITWI